MNVVKTELDGVVIVEPIVFHDSRGYFFESWSRDKYEKFGIDCDFIQDNESFSTYGVVRGLHWQAVPYTQAKLVRVVFGEVLDVAVDIREGSPTFGKHVAVRLSSENKRQLLIPRGFAHGFSVLSPSVIFAYKCDNAYCKDAERGLRYDSVGIDWLVKPEEMIVSDKDLKHPTLDSIEPWRK